MTSRYRSSQSSRSANSACTSSKRLDIVMMAARLAEAAAEVTPAVRHRYRRERSALQPVPERDVGVQQLRYGAGLFRVLGNLRESGFIDSGYGRRQFQVRPGDGKRAEEHTSELQSL